MNTELVIQKMMLIIKRALQSLAISLVMMLLIVFWLAFSNSGLNMILYSAQFFMPGSLQIGKIEGSLFQKIILEDIHYQVDSEQYSAELKAAKIMIRGEWLGLLSRKLTLDQWSVENAELQYVGKETVSPQVLIVEFAQGGVRVDQKNNHFDVQLLESQGIYNQLPFQIQMGVSFENEKLSFKESIVTYGEHQFKIKINTQPQILEEGKVNAAPTLDWEYQTTLKNNESLQLKAEVQLLPQQISWTKGVLQKGKKRLVSFSGLIKIKDFDPLKNLKDQVLEGQYQAEFNDLSPIYQIFPAISRLKAKPMIKGNITGVIEKPQISIQGNVGTAIFSIPKPHITVKEFKLHIEGTLGENLAVSSSGFLGGNPFYLKGKFNPLLEGTPGEFELKAKDIRVLNTANMRIVASPNITLHYQAKTLAITGFVDIVEGEIVMRKELSNVIVSNDVIFTGVKNLNLHPEAIKMMPNVEFNIQNRLYFKGYGLDAKVRGKLKIEKRMDGLYMAEGRLTLLEGKYRLPSGAGHIYRGHLFYPPGTLLNNPVLDIRVLQKQAGKLNESGDVGVYVQGSLQKPLYHLYSSEPLKQNEILSRLGCGGTQFEGEANQKQLFSQTAMLLGGGANPILDSLQTKFGLEEFGIQSKDAYKYISSQEGSDTALVVGKSFGKRVYLQFMQGMVEPTSTLRVQYFMNPYMAVSAETSTTGMGGDLSFSVEKD